MVIFFFLCKGFLCETNIVNDFYSIHIDND